MRRPPGPESKSGVAPITVSLPPCFLEALINLRFGYSHAGFHDPAAGCDAELDRIAPVKL
jgi:hypothetical protein